jgi:ATP-dependent DNA helicase RecG
MYIRPSTPITELSSVGKTIAGRLARLNIYTVYDLLYHFPFRYEDFRETTAINQIELGQVVTISGKVEMISSRRSKNRRLSMTECFVSDDTGSLKIIWFNQPYIAKQLENGSPIRCSGKISGTMSDPYLANPTWEKTDSESASSKTMLGVYSTTNNITQKQIRFLIKQSLIAVHLIHDWLPTKYKDKLKLADIQETLINIHQPETDEFLQRAYYRLKFDEVCWFFLTNKIIQQEVNSYCANPVEFNETVTKQLIANLTFQLTDDQKISAWQILQDMSKPKPMNRLLHGDVGCGKTVVAAIACANVINHGGQAALLAPTEILANQHFISCLETLAPLNYSIALTTASKKLFYCAEDQQIEKISSAKLNKLIADNKVGIVVGTHTLLNEKIKFAKLNLVIIDEQHRFGVKQRQKLKEKSGQADFMPHLLSMSATPIPRTLALTLYGDLNLSAIKQLPPNRKNPQTNLVTTADQQEKVFGFIREQITAGRQAYVVCPLIETTENLEIKSVIDIHAKLVSGPFADIKVGLLHGKMKTKEKDEIMEQFNQGQINVLVSTTVIEVGVNVPNANCIIIYSPERFGLAQLHQLRGRVNRSHHQPYCYLFAEHYLAQQSERLKIFCNTFDGFALAEADLKFRGYGNLSGSQQTGYTNPFKLANFSDSDVISLAKSIIPDLINELSTKEIEAIIEAQHIVKHNE